MYGVEFYRADRDKKGRPRFLEVMVGEICADCNADALLGMLRRGRTHPFNHVIALSQGMSKEKKELFEAEGIGVSLVTIESPIPHVAKGDLVLGSRGSAYQIALLGMLLAGHMDDWLLEAIAAEKKGEDTAPTDELNLLRANLDACRKRFLRTIDYEEWQATIGYSIQSFLARIGKGPSPPIVIRK
jgi:hypothetical protein